MKFEKRAAAGETPTEQEPQETGKKPVIVYILILFLAAFLLMFLSLLAHQRSNSEAAEFRFRHSGNSGYTGADH